jgi:hypothetical protein
MSWDIGVGEELKRREVHDQYGGNRQRGIVTIPNSPNILLFEYGTGRSYGYSYDGPHDDGTYHYTGEGPDGDQTFRGGNAAIRDHQRTGRVLRLFKQTRPTWIQYLGKYAISEDQPWYRADSPGRDGELRSVIVFRLRLDNEASVPDVTILEPRVLVVDIDLEAHKTETFQVNRARPPTNAERREAELVQRYASWLADFGHTVCRKQITFPGQVGSLFTDLYDQTDAELVEAKGAASRTDVRLALGQILDYDRFVESDHRAILLPVRPAADLVDLLTAHYVSCIYETPEGKFERVDPL